jgi:uncharacterized cupredoxin-like copper-binding protein
VRAAIALAVCAIMAGAAYGSATGSDVRTIEIGINHSRFRPNNVAVEPGEPVRFVIRNDDPIDHEFIVGDEAVQRRHETGTEPHHGSIPTEISVPAGQVVTTTIEFSTDTGLDLSKPLLFGCHLPGHYDFGMKGEIRIET